LGEPTQATIHSSHPKTLEIIEKRQPPPKTTRPGEADRNGHPARVKAKGAAGICSILTADERG